MSGKKKREENVQIFNKKLLTNVIVAHTAHRRNGQRTHHEILAGSTDHLLRMAATLIAQGRTLLTHNNTMDFDTNVWLYSAVL